MNFDSVHLTFEIWVHSNLFLSEMYNGIKNNSTNALEPGNTVVITFVCVNKSIQSTLFTIVVSKINFPLYKT